VSDLRGNEKPVKHYNPSGDAIGFSLKVMITIRREISLDYL
jgi:hypothetical protein